MTTQRQIKKLLTPLLERHEDLALCGRWLMITPIHHVMRGMTLMFTSSADWFYPAWAITNFCDPCGHYPLNWGDRLYPRREAHWCLTDPRMPGALFEIIEDYVLPMIRPVKTLNDIAPFLATVQSRRMSIDWDPLRQLPLLVALGKLDEAREVLRKRLTGDTRWTRPFLDDERAEVLGPLRGPLKRDDRGELARVLRGWEQMRIARLKMEFIWEPTQFPLELDA